MTTLLNSDKNLTVKLNFNEAMRDLISEIVRTVEDFHFIQMEHVAISASYCKSRNSGGLLAYLLPLRYRDGSPITRRERNGKTYHYGISPLKSGEQELLYIVYFMLPRFLRLSFQDKLDTVIHELYHISPEFNGDLRRLSGRSHLHGKSLKHYDAQVRVLSEKFLNQTGNSEVLDVLRAHHDEVHSIHIPEPRSNLIHVESH